MEQRSIHENTPYLVEWVDEEHAEGEPAKAHIPLDQPEPSDAPSVFTLGEHVETRERLSRLETTVDSVQETGDRIEGKIDALADTVEEVNGNAVSQERFERDFASKINASHRMTVVAKWAGGALAALASIGGGAAAVGLL